MNLSSIRQSYVGVVEQSIGLLSGSIFDNIAYGKDSATKEDVYKASKLADAHDFIMTLPDQYDTQLGEIGKSLSGGQKANCRKLMNSSYLIYYKLLLVVVVSTLVHFNSSESDNKNFILFVKLNRTTKN